MLTLLSYLLLVALVVHAGAHVALLVSLARRRPRYQALVAFALPPLAPYYGWRAGFGKLALVWLVALGAYAIGVGAANL